MVELQAGEIVQTGAQLAQLQKDTNELAKGGGAPVIIQDNSQNVSSSSQPLILPTPAMKVDNGGSSLPGNK